MLREHAQLQLRMAKKTFVVQWLHFTDDVEKLKTF